MPSTRAWWLEDDEGGRPADVDELPVLASIYEASVTQRGETGAPLRRIGATMTLEPGTLVGAERRAHGGFDLHAGVVVRAGDRERLEHLCRYLLRPPLASDRLQELDSGDVLLKLRTRWSDGTTHLRLSPSELLDRLCALIPRPRTARRRRPRNSTGVPEACRMLAMARCVRNRLRWSGPVRPASVRTDECSLSPVAVHPLVFQRP